MATRVLLVDDHEVVRRGLADMIDAEPDLEVGAQAGSVAEAVSAGSDPALDVHAAVLDVRLPDGDGIELCEELRAVRPELGVVILTAFDDDEALVDAHAAGARAFMLKQVRGSDLLRAIRMAAAGTGVTGRSGLANLAARAEDAGGTCDVETGPRDGTALRWRAPLQRHGG